MLRRPFPHERKRIQTNFGGIEKTGWIGAASVCFPSVRGRFCIRVDSCSFVVQLSLPLRADMTGIGYSVEELVPHAGAMLLLDRIESVSDEAVQATATVRCDGLFEVPGERSLPAWLGIEYLAQAIAAWSGYRERQQGRPIRPGFLVGTRRFESSVARLPAGTRLTIAAECLLEQDDGVSVFEGWVTGDEIRQSTRLKVYLPQDIGQYLKEAIDE